MEGQMGIFDIFRSKPRSAEERDKPRIEFGFRGEDITYRLPGKELYVGFTYINGPRFYSESIEKWKDGSPLTEEEKEKVFSDVVRFLKRKRNKPIVVINTDDPSKKLWEHLCSTNQTIIKEVEYTSDEEQLQFERNMYLGFLKAGKGLVINEAEIKNEQDLDNALRARRKKRAV
jgi:uncharacterized protein YeaC (DUF1315 family)